MSTALHSTALHLFVGGDGRPERVQVSELRTPAFHLRPVGQRVGQAGRVGHQQQRVHRQRPMDHPSKIVNDD